MASVADLSVRVGADISPLQRGMRGAGASVETFSAKVSRNAAVMRNGALAIAAAGAAAAALMQRSLAVADSIDKAAGAANIGAERLQTLRFAAEQSGISAEKMDGALAKFNVTLGRMQAGMESSTGGVAQSFERLGLSAEKMAESGLTTEQAFDQVIGRLADVSDGAEQAAIAAQLFGKAAGPDMRNLLVQGAAGVEALEDAARGAGNVIDEALVKRGVEIADKWASVMASMTGYTHQFALQAATMIDNAFGFTESGRIEMIRGQIDKEVLAYEEQQDRLIDAQRNLSSVDTGVERTDLPDMMKNQMVADLQRRVADERAGVSAVEDELNVLNQQLLDIDRAKTERENRLAAVLNGRRQISGGGLPGAGGAVDVDADPVTPYSELADKLRPRLQVLEESQAAEREVLKNARTAMEIDEQTFQQNMTALTAKHAEERRALESGGGGGGADGADPEFERLATRWKTKMQILEEQQAEEMAILANAREAGLLAEEEYQVRLTQLQQEHADARRQIARLEAQARVDTVLGAGAEVLNALGSFNSRALKAAKIAGAAQALVSTLQGSAEALKLPFPANLAAQAAVMAKGLGLVAAIKGVSSGGGGAVSGGGGSAAGLPAAAPPPLQVRFPSIPSSDFVTWGSVTSMFDQLQQQAGDRRIQYTWGATA